MELKIHEAKSDINTTRRVRDFNIYINRQSNYIKNQIDIKNWNNTINQLDLTDIYRTPPNNGRIDNHLKHTQSIHQGRTYFKPLKKLKFLKRIENIPIMFPDHNGMKLEIINKSRFGDFTHM